MKFPAFYVRKYSPTTLDERNRLYTIFVDLRNMDYGREPGIMMLVPKSYTLLIKHDTSKFAF